MLSFKGTILIREEKNWLEESWTGKRGCELQLTSAVSVRIARVLRVRSRSVALFAGSAPTVSIHRKRGRSSRRLTRSLSAIVGSEAARNRNATIQRATGRPVTSPGRGVGFAIQEQCEDCNLNAIRAARRFVQAAVCPTDQPAAVGLPYRLNLSALEIVMSYSVTSRVNSISDPISAWI